MPFERLQRRTTNRRRPNRHHFRHVRFRSSPTNTWNTSAREENKIHRPVDDRLKKKKKILTALLRSKRLGGAVFWKPYPSYYNGLSSPFLVQRFRCQKSRSLSMFYQQYETSYLFCVTLSFFCNIICYLISVFAFSSVTLSKATTFTKAKEPSLPCYLPRAGGRIIGFINFSNVLVLCEMQSASSRMWTRIAVFNSYDDTITPCAPPYFRCNTYLVIL